MVLGYFDFLRLNCENLFFVFVFCFFGWMGMQIKRGPRML